MHGEVTTNCEFAGDFFILGGANEMPWEFNHPYYFDITDAVSRLGEDLDGHYAIRADVYSVNGTNLGSNVLPKPWGSHRPARGHTDREHGALHAWSGVSLGFKRNPLTNSHADTAVNAVMYSIRYVHGLTHTASRWCGIGYRSSLTH